MVFADVYTIMIIRNVMSGPLRFTHLANGGCQWQTSTQSVATKSHYRLPPHHERTKETSQNNMIDNERSIGFRLTGMSWTHFCYWRLDMDHRSLHWYGALLKFADLRVDRPRHLSRKRYIVHNPYVYCRRNRRMIQ